MSTTTPSFSPLRCLPRWLVVPFLLFAVGGFFLGRWLNALPVVTIKATRLGKVVAAKVYRGEAEVGDTPYVYRGKRGEALKLTVKHETLTKNLELTLQRGRREELVEFHPMRLEFRAYDTLGRPVPRAFMKTPERPDVWAPMTAGPAKLTRDVGTVLEVIYKSEDPKYKPQHLRTQPVTWQAKEAFDAWLESGLETELREEDQYYGNWDGIIQQILSESSDAAHEYPLVFVAPEHWHGPKVAPKTRTNSDTPKPDDPDGPDIPLSYEKTTSKRLLTEADLKGKTAEALRITKNEPYARHGYKFSSSDLLGHFQKFEWYRPTTTDQDAVYAECSQIEKSNIDFLTERE